MKKFMIAAITLGSLLCYKPALAGEGLSGYVGVHGGKTFVDTEISSGPFSFDGLGGKGWTGGVHGGIDYTSASKVFFGIYAGYDWSNAESSLNAGLLSATVGLDDSYYGGGRLGYDWGKYKLYVLGGYRHTDLQYSGILAGAGGPGSLKGLDMGIGTSYRIAPGVDLGLEGVWTNYQGEKVGSVKLDPDTLNVMARLSFALGGNEPSPFADMGKQLEEPQGSDPKLSRPRR